VATEPLLDIDVSLDVGALALRVRLATQARRIAIVGPSGAGKSTLLRIVAGLEPRATGTVRFAGDLWREGRRERVPTHRRRVGWVPQDVRLFPHRTVDANVRFAGASEEDARTLATQLGIAHLLGRRPRHLSGGEAQRVALARALLARPRLLLLDEPFAALDRKRRADLAALLRDAVTASGAALVLVTHDERDVAALAEAVYEMGDGTLAAAGAPAAPTTRA
jgi:ABC-type molybdate transport system ATPase subunit